MNGIGVRPDRTTERFCQSLQVPYLEGQNRKAGLLLYIPSESRNAFKKEIVASIIIGVMIGSVGPFVAFIASHRLHSSATLISFIAAAPWAGSFLSPVYANALRGKRKMAFICNTWIIGRSMLILMLFARTPYTFALVAVAAPFIGSMVAPGYTFIMKAIYPDDHRGKLMSYNRVAMWLTATAATFAVGPILRAHAESYRVVFPIAALFGVASVLVFRSIQVPGDDDRADRPRLRESMSDLVSILKQDRRFAWFIFATSVYGFGNFLMAPIYPKIMDEVLHMDEGNVAIYCVLLNVVMMLSLLYWGHHIDSKGAGRAVSTAILVNALMPVIFFFAPSFVWILPAAVAEGIMISALELGYMNVALEFAPPGREMDYQGLQSCVQGLRGILGPIAGGILYDIFHAAKYNVKYVFVVPFAIILLGWALLVFGGAKKPAAAGD